MLNNIALISKLSQITQNQILKTYNINLPITLEVLEKRAFSYLVKLGHTIIEAKSAQELRVGAKYWAILKDTNTGDNIISNLVLKPQVAEIMNSSSIAISVKEFLVLLESKKPKQIIKDNLINIMQTTQNRDDFLLSSNMLLAMEQNITSLVISDNGRKSLLQIRPKNKQEVEFSAIFAHLGVVWGKIYSSDVLLLKVQFQNVLNLLNKYKSELNYLSKVEIICDKNITLLSNLCDENLIDCEV